MPRWLMVTRGMVSMGLTFAAVAGVFFAVLAVVSGLFFPGVEDDLPFMIIAGSVWAFAIGVAFSGILAIAARGVRFDKLSLPRVAVLGAGGGLVLAGLLVAATWQEWSAWDALVPVTFLPLLGGGSATATLVLARRAGPALKSGDESRSLARDEATGGPVGVNPSDECDTLK